ncbi:MAG: hypothetical protein EZS28_056149, partial [Streblomastix strix]
MKNFSDEFDHWAESLMEDEWSMLDPETHCFILVVFMIESETEEWSEILIHLIVMKCGLQIDLYHEVLMLQQLSEALNIFHYEMCRLEMFIQQRTIYYLSPFSLILFRYRKAITNLINLNLHRKHQLDDNKAYKQDKSSSFMNKISSAN